MSIQPGMRDAARIMLTEMRDSGFALAGSAALEEHRLLQRPVGDLDLFTTMPAIRQHSFADAVGRGTDALSRHGYAVQPIEGKQGAEFAAYEITAPSGQRFKVDIGVDYRAEEPTMSEIGPVLSQSDAVAGKINALYTRDSMKDIVDIDSIRRSGRYSDDQLLQLGQDHDPGFDRKMFGNLVQQTCQRPFKDDSLGIPAGQVQGARDRVSTWAKQTADGRMSASPQLDLVRALYPRGPKPAVRHPSAGMVLRASAGTPYRPTPGRGGGRDR